MSILDDIIDDGHRIFYVGQDMCPLNEGHSDEDYQELLQVYFYVREACINFFLNIFGTLEGETASQNVTNALNSAGITGEFSYTDSKCEEIKSYLQNHLVVEPWGKVTGFLSEVKYGLLNFAYLYPYKGSKPEEKIRSVNSILNL